MLEQIGDALGAWWDTFLRGLAVLDVPHLLANPISRAIGLILIVYLTIRVIAAVYSGDKQNAELGPVAIRPHQSNRYGENTLRLPHELMPMSMDGVSARCRIFYVYNDVRGRRRKQLVHTISDARLSVSPVRLREVRDVIFGQEIPDVPSKYVCFPPADLQEPVDQVLPTPDRAQDYAARHKILENWKEDDTAAWVSTSVTVKELVASAKEEFITDKIAKLERRDKGKRARFGFKSNPADRPNVVGSYYLKFEFSHEPLFVLTRHPDRDLKMTAWLTVLTSMFALVMDAWPKDLPGPVMPVAGMERGAPAEPAPRVRAIVPPQ